MDPVRRVLLAVLGVLATLAVTAGMLALALETWAGMYPRSPLLARAEGWPAVGDWVTEVRRRHLGPSAPREEVFGGRLEVTSGPRVIPTPLAEATVGPVDLPPGVWPELWLRQGDRLRAQPSIDATVVVTMPVIANVRVVAARGEWRRVRWQSHEGWVRPAPDDGAPRPEGMPERAGDTPVRDGATARA
jgi:hypothetical protein